MKKIATIVASAIALVVIMLTLAGCSSFSRSVKSVQSDLTGGLYRTVTVYDYGGNVIKSWTGKFDVSESETEVYFDIDGKRVIIHGGIIINEEN